MPRSSSSGEKTQAMSDTSKAWFTSTANFLPNLMQDSDIVRKIIREKEKPTFDARTDFEHAGV